MTEGKDRETVPERWNAAGPGSDMWMDAAQDPRFAAGTKLEGEQATLLDYLRACRLAMEMKCAGLDPAQLACRSVPPSAMLWVPTISSTSRDQVIFVDHATGASLPWYAVLPGNDRLW